ncbi:MAG: hypothetical protein GXP54_08935 [Deltaproteobacteria bacterium]|nr:hypothetical protein [Deltaproteobacteria bacterium]
MNDRANSDLIHVGLPYGERLSAGRRGIELFARLLGLDAPGCAFPVEGVNWEEDHVRVEVGTGADDDVIFMFRPMSEKTPAFVRTDHIAVTYRHKEIPADLAEMVAAGVPARLKGMTFDELVRQLALDPELAKAKEKTVSDASPGRLLDMWGAPEAWADFFADGEIERGRLDSIDLPRLFRVIQHGELECAQQSPHEYAPTVSMVEYPWDDRVRDLGMPAFTRRFHDPPREAFEDIMQTTDLTEQDVVRGNPEKIRSIMECVLKQPNPNQKPIMFSKTCVSVVTGEDVESEVERQACNCDVPLFFLTVTRQSSLNLFKDLLVDRRLEAEAKAGPPDPDAVNLVGFPDTRDTAEVSDLLGRYGRKVNRLVIPDLGTDIIDDMPRASLNIIRSNANWRNFYEQVVEGSRIPHVEMTAPYGMEGTRRWLSGVLEALGREGGPGRIWAQYVDEHEAAWREARGRCSRHRLVFVMRGRDTHHLTDPASTWGVPLIQVVEELGFGMDVLLRLSGRNEAASKAGEVNGLFNRPGDHSIKGFNTFEMMRKRLADSRAQAAFTNHYFDWRISEAGKNRFSLRQFEVGLEGTIRTAARLADICETPFYGRYRRYLGRTADGFRLTTGRGEDS